MPYKDQYEPYGVSFESFEYCTTLYNTKYTAVFEKLYGEGGSKEVRMTNLFHTLQKTIQTISI